MEANIIECTTESHYVEDPYLPASVIIGEQECLGVHFIGYYRGDVGLVELQTVHGEGTVCQVTITLCDWFGIAEGAMPVPDATEGLYIAGGSRTIETGSLFATCYEDGIDVQLTDKIPMRYVRSGDVILGVAADGEVCQVLLANLSPEEAGHTRQLLQEDWDYRRGGEQ